MQKKTATWHIVTGILFLCAGILNLATATRTLHIVTGAMFLIAGTLQLIAVYVERKREKEQEQQGEAPSPEGKRPQAEENGHNT